MRIQTFLASASFALATGLSAITPAHAELQISKCKTRALIGGGLGALAGSMIAGKGDKTEGALIGGALGAGAGFGICKWMDSRSEARVQSNYQQAINKNKSVSEKWTAEDGSARSLKVAKPTKVAGPTGNCKQITASMSTPGGSQQMPAETYCQGTDGVWRPA
jgi:surface antigen